MHLADCMWTANLPNGRWEWIRGCIFSGIYSKRLFFLDLCAVTDPGRLSPAIPRSPVDHVTPGTKLAGLESDLVLESPKALPVRTYSKRVNSIMGLRRIRLLVSSRYDGWIECSISSARAKGSKAGFAIDRGIAHIHIPLRS